MKPFARWGIVAVALAALAACSGPGNQITVPPPEPVTHAVMPPAAASHAVHVSESDVAAAHEVRDFHYHIFPVSSQWGKPVRNDATKVFHPADLAYYGGPLMKTAVEHTIYVNCKTGDEKCWGQPEEFFQKSRRQQDREAARPIYEGADERLYLRRGFARFVHRF